MMSVHDDHILPFSIPVLDVQGRVVSLGPTLDMIVRRHDYPDAVARVLGEAMALAVLLAASLKGEGRFQLQTRSDGPVSMVIVDIETHGYDQKMGVRAMARFDHETLAAFLAQSDSHQKTATIASLLGTGHLALTVEQGAALSRYQGVVALDGQGLEQAAHHYFEQSEQIPTKVRLAVAEMSEAGALPLYRAGGILVQFLPRLTTSLPIRDLHPGDGPDERGLQEDIPDSWREAELLTATVEDHELVDPGITSEKLLYRLFHDKEPRVFDPLSLYEQCRCSHDRVIAMLRNFKAEERAHMIADDGTVEVTCEFCSRHYRFEAKDMEENNHS
jgi:molecular chaperone Hsp33